MKSQKRISLISLFRGITYTATTVLQAFRFTCWAGRPKPAFDLQLLSKGNEDEDSGIDATSLWWRLVASRVEKQLREWLWSSFENLFPHQLIWYKATIAYTTLRGEKNMLNDGCERQEFVFFTFTVRGKPRNSKKIQDLDESDRLMHSCHTSKFPSCLLQSPTSLNHPESERLCSSVTRPLLSPSQTRRLSYAAHHSRPHPS